MVYLTENTDAISVARELKLSHVGAGYYANKSGSITHKSFDGKTLEKISKDSIKTSINTINKLAVQKDETMPDPLGQPSGISNNKILPKKKKKSLVEFIHENKLPVWVIRYQLSSTNSRIHDFYVDAINQKEAIAKAKAFLHHAKFVTAPRIITKKNDK